jgi:16S rRNA (cytosine1407-C5)-methyltransferase
MYDDGEIFVQNISSMLVPIVLSPVPGDKILDLCAAPGAKTTQILSIAENIDLTAIEKSRTRYYKLLANLKNQGFENKATVLIMDGIWVRKKFPEEFDKILLDAPCSAEGLFYILNPKSYGYWKLNKIKEAVSKQKQLLNAAFYALKEGGELVYSTCTFAPEENEAMVDWFLKKYKDKIELLPVELELDNACSGIKHWKGNRFRFNVQYVKRIIPDKYFEAFFIAKFKKIAA